MADELRSFRTIPNLDGTVTIEELTDSWHPLTTVPASTMATEAEVTAAIAAHAAVHAPSDAQKNSNIIKAEIEAKLTGEIASHTHAGGSGDMTKAVYDPNADGVIVKAQLDAALANTSGTNTGDQTLAGLGGIAHSLATAVNDFLVASGAGAFVKKTLAEAKVILDWAADISTHAALTTGVHGVGAGTVAKTADITKTAVGLGNADNTSDANKPISSATQTALDTKEATANKGAVSGYAPLDASQKVPVVNLGGTEATGTKYLRSDQTWQTIAGGGDMLKSTYDPNVDGVIATAQLDMAAITAAVLLSAHPVGSIYESKVSTDPGTLFGGTWAVFGTGRVLVAIDAGDPDFDVVEETGGAKTVQSSAQTFAGSALASHQHNAVTAGTPAGTIDAHTAGRKGGTTNPQDIFNAPATHTFTGSALATHQHAGISAGTPAGTNTPGAATSVVQPYIVVYRWVRTA